MNANIPYFILLGLSATTTVCGNPNNKPNIIYILADDLGYGDLSCYGQTHFSTPNIDRLASEGIRFSQHYAGSAVSAPSRCCLMTGVHTGHATIRENRSTNTNVRIDLSDEDITIAQILQAQGYTTGIFGKWGLGQEKSKATPCKKGFDRFVGFIDQRDAHNHYPPFLHYNENRVDIPENQNGQCGIYANDVFTQEAKQFISENKDKPFFIYIPYTIPHAELRVPEDDMEHFRNRYLPETPFVPGAKSTYRAQEQPRAAFAAMITRMDRHIGEIMDLIAQLGLDEQTIIMFSSDNGPHKEGGADPYYFNSNGSQRGIKRDLYEGGIRVPFIVRWKGTIAPGSESPHICTFWDFMPTLCELTGTPIPEKIDGISYLPTLLGQTDKQQQHEVLYWEYPRIGYTLQAVRIGDFKAVRTDTGKPIEIYNIKKDPKEQNDLSAQYPELVKRAQNLFISMHTPSPHFPVPEIDNK